MTKADLLKYIDERLTQRSDGNIGLLMVRQYVADNMEDYHAQNLKAYAHDFDCTIEQAEKALTKGEEVPDTNVGDIISRQAAIDVLEERLQANGYSNVALVSELNRSIGYLMQLPSVQPSQKNESNTLDALDCVSRKAVIDALWHIRCNLQMMDDTQTADKMMRGLRLAENAVEQLPSVQPEVKKISYIDCANAMLMMWMDEVLTDGEYKRIMDKLNAHWKGEEDGTAKPV